MFRNCFSLVLILLLVISVVYAHNMSGNQSAKSNMSDTMHGGGKDDVEAHKMADSPNMKSDHAVMMNGAQALVQKELDMVRIDERVGEILNKDLTFYDQNGKTVTLKDYLGDKPLILSFAYYSCETLCQFVLQGEVDVFIQMKEMGLTIGEDYKSLTISFDSRDDKVLATSMQDIYGNKVNRELGNNDWTFLYGEDNEVKSVTEELGFYYNFIPDTGEFAHSTAIYIISPKGKISRYFYGIQFNPFDVKLAIIEAKDEKTRSTVDKIMLFCYSYDSDSRGYVLVARNVMKAGGVLTIIIMGGFFFILHRRKSKLTKET